MCAPGCIEHVRQRLARDGIDRRSFFRRAGAGAVGGTVLGMAGSLPAFAQEGRSFSRVVDLTHPLGPSFPTFSGQPGVRLERVNSLDTDGYNLFRWIIDEHTGTHMDAPMHFANGVASADQLEIGNLVVPLAVVDIRAKADGDPDAQLTPDDLSAWESEHGELPENACVAMWSGWDAHVATPTFRGADAQGGLHFPGFHPEATSFLMDERQIAAIAVDTLSLDYGASTDFAVHYSWLGSGRWGMECVANLGELPATGAIFVAGHPKIEGSTGGPSRVIALV
ncbi:cyclase family protein [Marinivivus vitaminiproducens]|uniref:cyclase family protein n=1 Tax=Marinivivus vitaminiproducens TaxID=3035935 RepID=UPI002799766C|nr:cyclase family protein [Geminicoccaceae bacterium SCSIO 64248]